MPSIDVEPPLRPDQIALFTRVPPDGPTIGYSYILFDRLGRHPDFGRIKVTPANRRWAEEQMCSHPGGILYERPKLLHLQAGLPFAEMMDNFLRSPQQPPSNIADYWTDVFETDQETDEGRRWLADEYLLRVEQKAGHIVTSTVIRRAMENFGANPDKIHVINVDIAPDFLSADTSYNPDKRREIFGGTGKDEYIVAYHARINPFKSQHLLLELAKTIDCLEELVPAEQKTRAVFVIIGDYQSSDYGRKLFEEVNRLGYLSSDKPVRLVFTGPKENGGLPEILAQADAFVHLAYDPPIISEHWGKNAVEAYALGLELFTWSVEGDAIQTEGVNEYGHFYAYQKEPSEELLVQTAKDLIASARIHLEKREQERQARTASARSSMTQKDAAGQIKEILANK